VPAASEAVDRCPCSGHGTEREYGAVVDAVVRGLRDEPDVLLDALARRMRELAATERLEAAARTRDQLAALRGVLHHQRLLRWLRGSGTLRVLTPSGVVELADGLLAGGEDDAPRDEDGTDERSVVARWLTRQVVAGRARLLEPVAANLPPELSVG
jgi:hypothetical protein